MALSRYPILLDACHGTATTIKIKQKIVKSYAELGVLGWMSQVPAVF